MKIVNKKQNDRVPFGDVNPGTVYSHDINGDLFMKLSFSSVHHNTVRLADGHLAVTTPDFKVILVDAELIVN